MKSWEAHPNEGSSPEGTTEEMSHSHVRCLVLANGRAAIRDSPGHTHPLRGRAKFLALHGRTVSFSRPRGTWFGWCPWISSGATFSRPSGAAPASLSKFVFPSAPKPSVGRAVTHLGSPISFWATGKSARAFSFWCIQSNRSRRGSSSRKAAPHRTHLCRVEVKML